MCELSVSLSLNNDTEIADTGHIFLLVIIILTINSKKQ